MKRIIIMLMISTQLFAQNSVTLNKGDIAPFKGNLINLETSTRLIKADKRNMILEDLRIVQEDLTDFHRQDAKTQRKKLSEAKFDGFLSNTIYFLAGVLISGFAFKVTQKVGDI